MHPPISALIIPELQRAGLLTSDVMKEEGGQNRVVVDAYEGILLRGLRERPRLLIAEYRGRPFVIVCFRALDLLHGVEEDGVLLAEMLKERRELAPDGRGDSSRRLKSSRQAMTYSSVMRRKSSGCSIPVKRMKSWMSRW